ncbi:12502_t:CDS:2 [Acaulospora morrowiae]|uniref:12502_t:CDS:1 n=1 Tax=Acaulospora morrowiae TaxID=94023 RepID=A0A9N9IGS0_9GLOM|nr:12502_t:CDS:2 [Acaulospora morrowiae]
MASSTYTTTLDTDEPLKPYIPLNETPEEKKKRVQMEKQARKHSEAIDKQLKAEKEEMEKRRDSKLLLLGSSESGKTTVLKQLKIIHGKGLEGERQQYRRIVHINTLTAMKALVNALPSLEYTPDPIQAAIRDNKLDDDAFDLFHEHVDSIKSLWEDPAIKNCFSSASEIGLQDSAKYFLDNADRFSNVDYLPTDEDILQARIRTVGVTEHKFEIDRVTYKIYDVGGHRSQRHFWAPYFDDVNAIIFMAAISAFDQTLEEDPEVNRMSDSIDLFDSICNNPLMANTSIILFLNKIDILKQKLSSVNVKDYFPDYEGDNKFQSVVNFFKGKFLERAPENKRVYTHLTHATDTKQMRLIVATVNDIVQRRQLRDTGF